MSAVDKFITFPNLLWFADYIASPLEYMRWFTWYSDIENCLYLFSLVGSVLGLLAFVGSRLFITRVSLIIMWFLYYSIYWVGGTFMSFQWDIMLLDAGFLMVLFAPTWPRSFSYHSEVALIVRELIKWMSVWLMVASGLIKLLSGCPTWWNLTALDYHYETQPLPTMFSWHAH